MDNFLNIIMTAINPLFILNLVFVGFVIFSARRNPAVTWAWLIVVLLIPYLGFIVYLILGFDGRKHHVFYAKNKEDQLIYQNYLNMDINGISFSNNQMDAIKHNPYLNMKKTYNFDDMIYLNFISGNGAYSENNKIDIFDNGESKFECLLNDIINAKKYIHVQYYIFRNDTLGRSIIEILAKKATEGVEVCLLIDGMGCATTNKKLFKPLNDAGGKLAIFLPPYFVRLNFRNHRKIVVIDGVIGYVGGFNIGREYLGLSKRFGNWRDSHIKITGEGINQLELRFIMDWNFTSEQCKIPLTEKYFFTSDAKYGNAPMQIVSSGPDTRWSSIHHAYTKMISGANKFIFIQTPYFVPDDSIIQALKIARLSGVDIKIMIPAHPDHPFVYWAALSYLGELLDVGVKCYKYEKGFVHSKLLIADGMVSSVGTANMDVRSFKLNFEINAFIYDIEVSSALCENYLKDLEDCTEITKQWYYNRSNITKIKESVSRLLSPIL